MLVDCEIRPLSDVTSEEAACLLQKGGLYSRHGKCETMRIWNWKHVSNPAGTSFGMAAYVGDGQKRELIALRPFMQWELAYPSGRKVRAARAVDAVVHPGYRRRGLFTSLTELGLQELAEHGIELVFNTPNNQSAPGDRKMGWRLMGHPRLMVRVRAPLRLAARTVMRREAVCRGRQAIPAHWKPYREAHSRLSSLLTAQRPFAHGLTTSKTPEFLWWRYGSHPSMEYRVVEVNTEAGTLIGAAVVHEDKRSNAIGAAIVEIACEADSPGPGGMKQILRTILTESRADYFVAGRATADASAWASSAFLPVPWRNVFFAVKAVLARPAETPCTHQRAWALTLGDLEEF